MINEMTVWTEFMKTKPLFMKTKPIYEDETFIYEDAENFDYKQSRIIKKNLSLSNYQIPL